MQSQTIRAKAVGAPRKRLHSIHALLRGDEFVGEIEVPGGRYDYRFQPTAGGIINGHLAFVGDFSVIGAGRRPRTTHSVKATLASIQSAFGTPPDAPPYYAARIAGTPESAVLPVTESTDATGHIGVLYFQLSPLDGRALGVPYDCAKVQLNLRVAPVNRAEQELQWLLSAISGALLGSIKDQNLAQEYLEEINRRIKV
ncbi:MAG: hypothetical protein ABI882_00040 [Acidobacteriota bacterium]